LDSKIKITYKEDKSHPNRGYKYLAVLNGPCEPPFIVESTKREERERQIIKSIYQYYRDK